MEKIHLQETFVNATEDRIFGDSGRIPFETWADRDNIGGLFKDLQKEYGRAVTMHEDTEDGTLKVGWVFTKRMQYEDSKETYIREVWVRVYVKNEDDEFEDFPFQKPKRKVDQYREALQEALRVSEECTDPADAWQALSDIEALLKEALQE